MLKRIYFIIKQRLYQLINSNKHFEGKVYMFHEINDSGNTYSISPMAFKDFVEYLYKNRKIVTFEELKNNNDSNNVVLTFDDFYSSVYNNAFPILKELDVPYYVFVCNEFLNRESYANESMINHMIKDSKCILGSHGLKHELSRNIDNKVLKSNLVESKESLENIFKVSVVDFAFPFGSMYACTNDNIRTAQEVFDNVCMTYNISYNNKYKNVIPRININSKNYSKEIK